VPRAPPKKDKRSINILGFTGGGEATTTFIWEALRSDYDDKIVEIVHAIMIHDDGGRTRKEQDALLSSFGYQIKVPAVGDYAAQHSWASAEPFKRDVMFGYVFEEKERYRPRSKY